MLYCVTCKTLAQASLQQQNSTLKNLYQDIDSHFSVAARLYHYDQKQSTGDYVNDNTLIAYHTLQSFVLGWRVDNQLYQSQHSNDLSSDNSFELSEVSWSDSLMDNENDLWQVGKFNAPFDPSYVFQNTGFFEAQINPFDDFASSEGIPMISASYWLGNYYISALISSEGQTSATKDLSQWGLTLQKDFSALSTGLILQQYQHSNIGLGGIFTYVVGDGLEFHGSSFLRKGGVWLDKTNKAVSAQFDDKSNLWLPSITLGTIWSGEQQQLLLEWNYQREKFSKSEIDTLNAFSSNRSNTGANGLDIQQSIVKLHQERYQQHYLFIQYQYLLGDHSITANSLIGQDISALSQLKYEYLSEDDLAYWIAFESTAGDKGTEFKQIPWNNRLQIGLQWKI